jgi:argininosuccinate lyase
MKLWDKGYQLDPIVEQFMTGDDPTLDQALVRYDCMGSIAHAKMLVKIGILTKEESSQLVDGLQEIIALHEQGKFTIQQSDEDVHTAIENWLTAQLGQLGKKLHTARSRNDQVLVDLRLYAKKWLLSTIDAVLDLATVLCDFAQRHASVPIPGRTHFQRAMPSSLGLWAGAFAESLLDDILLLKCVYQLNDQCPLGSAASFGAAIPLDRQYCAELLGFAKVQNNVLYVNNSRGKFEAMIIYALVQIMNDLGKCCTDIIIYCTPEFGYLTLPEKFCPGSSLMPQKRNPCPLELIRAKSATVQAMLIQVLEITRALPSGYHRDFQETKRPLLQSCAITLQSIQVLTLIFAELKVNQQQCLAAFTPELFATDEVLHRVQQGMAFRDAYRQVAAEGNALTMPDPVVNILSKTHLGATGNLGLSLAENQIISEKEWLARSSSLFAVSNGRIFCEG